MNWNHLKYQLLNNLREHSFMFWTVAYPLFMALIFHTAFQGMLDPQPLVVTVGIEAGSPAAAALGEVDILDARILDRATALDQIRAGELTGFVAADLTLTVGKSGIAETVLASVVSQMKQMQALGVPMENFDFQTSYVRTTPARFDPLLIPFFSLIGMFTLYSAYMGIEFGRIIQADQSMEALRLNVVPLRKQDFIIGSLLIGLVINLVSNLLLLLFFRYGLGMDLITRPLPSLAVILAANVFGIMLGLLIGSISRISSGAKNGVIIGLTLLLSFASGMMSPDIKILIEEGAPWLNALNPVAIVTTQLYRINFLDQTASLGTALATLLAMAVVLMGIAILFLRRKSYDSL